MLLLASYDVVFREVPDEVTLALNIAGCPNGCPGCHSPHLQRPVGEPLDNDLLAGLLRRYGSAVTCVCFMGGDAEPSEVARLARLVRSFPAGIPNHRLSCATPGEPGGLSGEFSGGPSAGRLRTAWYSGRSEPPSADDFDYVKLGPYVAGLGGLDSPTTNQRFYRVENDGLTDLTFRFMPCK